MEYYKIFATDATKLECPPMSETTSIASSSSFASLENSPFPKESKEFRDMTYSITSTLSSIGLDDSTLRDLPRKRIELPTRKYEDIFYPSSATIGKNQPSKWDLSPTSLHPQQRFEYFDDALIKAPMPTKKLISPPGLSLQEYAEYGLEGIQKRNNKKKAEAKPDPKLSTKFKTELCKNWVVTGKCPYNGHCCFAHGELELCPQDRHVNYKTIMCKEIEQNRHCKYTGRCVYAHSFAELKHWQDSSKLRKTEIFLKHLDQEMRKFYQREISIGVNYPTFRRSVVEHPELFKRIHELAKVKYENEISSGQPVQKVMCQTTMTEEDYFRSQTRQFAHSHSLNPLY